MDSIAGLAIVGIATSGCTGFLLGRDAVASWKQRRHMREALAESPSAGLLDAAAWRLAKGIAPFMPAAEALLRHPFVRRYVMWGQQALASRGFSAQAAPLLSMCVGGTLFLIGLGWVVSSTPVFGVALAGCALMVLGGAAKADAERRAGALRDEVPDALRSIGVCFRAGLSLMQTLRQTGTEMKGPLRELFLSSARLLDTGATATEALAAFRRRSDISELAFVAVALDVQHLSGGSLSQVLDAARESVEGEIELERSLRVQTAQAKLSARIVTAMPFVLVALFSLVSPGFLMPFFESVPGMLLLAAALAMQIAGVLAVHRMLDVNGR